MKIYKTIKERIKDKNCKDLIAFSREVNFVSANILAVQTPITVQEIIPVRKPKKYMMKRNAKNNTICVLGMLVSSLFGMQALAREAVSSKDIANWVIDSGDNLDSPFIVIDKNQATVWVYQANGSLIGSSPALLGLAVGDDSIEGIGRKPLNQILPHERTTSAGRFVSEFGLDLKGQEIFWVDYNLSIALHKVVEGNVKDKRLQRLATSTPLDNKITYGCINVSKNFYYQVVQPLVKGKNAIVYILPEVKDIFQVFPSYYFVNKTAIKS